MCFVKMQKSLIIAYEWILHDVTALLFQPITDDDVDRIATCIRVLAEQSPLMFDIFNQMCRQSLASMLDAKRQEEAEFAKVLPVWQ